MYDHRHIFHCVVFISFFISRDMLSLGSSQIWEDALEQVTGTRLMDSSSLVKYFQPLLDFLKEENRKNGDTVGWPDYSFQPPTSLFVYLFVCS